MKIVVTGALGHIGSFLIRQLPTAFPGCQIVMIDNLMTQRYASLFDLPATAQYQFVEADVITADLPALLTGADAVIHLAAITDAAGTAATPEVVFENNLQATERVAAACQQLNVPLIFPSSTSVYGSQSEFVDEACPDLQPQSPYADCKIREERLLQDMAAAGLPVAICRFGTIYGTAPGMRFHTAVNKFCWQAVMGQPVTVWRTALHQKRPYLALSDAADAVIWILRQQLFTGEIYNILSGNHTVADVLAAIQSHYPDLLVEEVEHQIMNQLSYEVGCAKFCQTGFDFTGNLQDGVTQTLQLLANAHQGTDMKIDWRTGT